MVRKKKNQQKKNMEDVCVIVWLVFGLQFLTYLIQNKVYQKVSSIIYF